MKKLLISLGLLAAMATPAAFAHTDLSIGIGLGPYYDPPPVYYYEPAPRVYYEPYPYYGPRVVYRSYYGPRYYHDRGHHRGHERRWHDRDDD